MTDDTLPTWRPGLARDAVGGFLAAAEDVPAEERVAVFDVDGTLWCEKPRYIQLDFFLAELQRAVASHPELEERSEYRALLAGDQAAIADIGLVPIAAALVELCEGMTPEEFEERVRGFFADARHGDRGVSMREMRYQPMLDLVRALRSKGFEVFLVTGGGTEFVRAVSRSLFGVPPEGVVGSQVGYELVRVDGRPQLRRTDELFGAVNEGAPKISNIQRLLGRRPIFAAGNSPGDREMLEYATSGRTPSLAILVEHDDAEREYAYRSVAGTFDSDEPIEATAERLGWTSVSMRDDWETVFAR